LGLLLKKYLADSVIFSRYTDVPDIFLDQPRQAPSAIAPGATSQQMKQSSSVEVASPDKIKNL
jgi:hypothetical protein